MTHGGLEPGLSATLTNSEDVVLVIETDGTITAVCGAVTDLLGYSDAALWGENVFEHIPQDDRKAVSKQYQSLTANGGAEPFTTHHRFERHSGEAVWLESTWSNQTDTPLEGYVVNLRRATGDDAASHGIQWADRAIEASGHAIYLTDTDGRITYVNPAFETMTGYRAADAVGQTPRLLQSGKMPDNYYERLWKTIQAGRVWEEEIINRTRTGDVYHAHQTIAPVTTVAGEIEAYVAIQTDITERKTLESELEASLRHHQETDRLLRHNVRNALNVIDGNATLLRKELTGESAHQADTIVATSDALLATVEHAREITKLLANPPPREAVSLPHLIEDSVTTLHTQFPHARITSETPEACRLEVSPAIDRAVHELIENAIKHTDTDTPNITVTLDVTDDDVTLQIADNGPGIPELEQQLLTQDHEIDQLHHSTGMGLRLVSIIVTQSGGTLSIETGPAGGSTVTITFPDSRPQQAAS